MVNVLCERGAFDAEPVTADDVPRAARVHDRHHWLVRRWLELLADAGRLDRDPGTGGYTLRRPADRRTVEEAWRLVERQCAHGMCTPDFVRYHLAHVERLDALLEDEQNPFDLLFPEGRMELAHAVYRDDAISRHLNAVAAATVREIAAARGGGRRLRVLEVGAGTGAATAAVLPALDGAAADYLFTDVTPFFLAEAKERFGARPWVRFGMFDLDGDPRAQGLTPNSFDVVLAAGVLNSARDPRRAVATAAELLAPGGWLVFTEPTADLPHILLTQGFMMTPDGGDRTRGRTTLLSRREWADAIADAGGETVVCLPADDEPLAAHGMHVLAARFGTDRRDLRADELAAFLAERLPAHMIPAPLQIVDALPVTGNGKIDRKVLASWRPAAPAWTTASEPDASSDDLTARLGRMWADALGLPRIGPDENLYDHGADSLVLARMAGRLREEVPEASGVAYDTLLRQMLNEPTVAALARALRALRDHGDHGDYGDHGDEVGPGGPASAETGTASGARRGAYGNTLLVPFGGGPDGPVRVLFHAALGTMDYFQSLGRELVAQDLGPVVGVAVADADAYCAIEPKRLIARAADDYAESLIADGHTRFQLVGYCLGGLLAVEVGRRLLERGVEIADLTLVDSIPMFVETDEELAYESIFVPNLGLDPVAAVFGEEVDPADVYRAIDLLMAEHGNRVPAGALARLGGDLGLDAVAAAVRARSALSQGERLAAYARASAERAGVPVGPELVPSLFRVCRHSMMASRFDPEPYAGDITFLRATEAQSFGITAGVTHLTANFWKEICLGEFRLVDVAGNHFSVIEPPHLSTVADHLAAPLRRSPA
ncbi:methyltransferase [Thermopolyspora sp. NPDC052614]|uniref:thioesterase domain-containing protein n=1 Tax=Thermopolyspora sp. NPDC052614 TaxID=3155682 RepID=UPI0034419378